MFRACRSAGIKVTARASWRVDETYVKVGGQWKYSVPRRRQAWAADRLHAADRRNTCAAHRFLGKALKTMRNWPPHSITTDKLGSYPKAIRRLRRKGKVATGDESPHVENI